MLTVANQQEVALVRKLEFDQLQADHFAGRRIESVDAFYLAWILVWIKWRSDQLGRLVGESGLGLGLVGLVWFSLG